MCTLFGCMNTHFRHWKPPPFQPKFTNSSWITLSWYGPIPSAAFLDQNSKVFVFCGLAGKSLHSQHGAQSARECLPTFRRRRVWHSYLRHTSVSRRITFEICGDNLGEVRPIVFEARDPTSVAMLSRPRNRLPVFIDNFKKLAWWWWCCYAVHHHPDPEESGVYAINKKIDRAKSFPSISEHFDHTSFF